MSIGDILCSVAMACNTQPVPIYEWNEDRQVFAYHGFDSVDAQGTQGFFFLFGVFVAYTLKCDASLFILSLRNCIQNEGIKDRTESRTVLTGHSNPIKCTILMVLAMHGAI